MKNLILVLVRSKYRPRSDAELPRLNSDLRAREDKYRRSEFSLGNSASDLGWHRFLLLLGNTVFSTSNYVDVIFAAWENFSYSYFGTVTLIPAETLHSFLELLFWHKISSHHLRVTNQGAGILSMANCGLNTNGAKFFYNTLLLRTCV
ncbi:hypothetical protein OUZ56_016312 [Daphnia magna]|uniref:Uncharacterized protein n=1 Tax=Daphnia magna TaxID=35525 RepID=A0ABR0AQA7_9CRUS|nr:hypothetical protein OUZ56_016312 [Daphnia magna]